MKRAILVILAAALAVLGVAGGISAFAERRSEREQLALMRRLLPGSGDFMQLETDGADEAILRVFRANEGHVIETVTNGYGGGVVLLTGVDGSGRVTGVAIRQMEETRGVGSRIARDEAFLRQFLGTSANAEIGGNVDGVSGATVTSKAVAKGVNAAAGYVTGADISSGATMWGG